MDLGLKGRKAIVTGASRGIGRSIATELASEGVDLAICGRTAESLEEARKDLESRGVRVFAKGVDVGNGDELKSFIDEAAAELGGVDILVSWKANFEVDLMGAVRSVDAATPHLTKSDGGSVIFIGTTAAVETFMGPTSYNAIKAAMITHANGLSQTLGPQGIRVNVVSPGPIFFEGGAWDTIKQHMKPMYESTLKACPNGRLGTPEEVANAVVFLASPRASLLSGVNLVADGGFTKRVNF
jgi:NAD(P)-dependent dehydrogenase (short-subunit alcohol dehydrogenase family)